MDKSKSTSQRDWRRIAGEIGIIVVGVLIALAAEQAAQSFNLRQRASAAEEAMALEIENSLLANAELVRLDRCVEVQLLALEQAIVTNDRVAAGRIVERGSIFGAGRLWADNAFEAALTAQISDYLGSEKLKRYSQVYDMIRKARAAQEQRELTISALRTLRIAGAPASPEITQSLLTAAAQLRSNKEKMDDLGELIAMFAKKDLALEVTRSDYLAARGRVANIEACEKNARLAQAG
ncbi:MAG: hypothetical protein V4696_02470 [Pseudomonadota bacterium]